MVSARLLADGLWCEECDSMRRGDVHVVCVYVNGIRKGDADYPYILMAPQSVTEVIGVTVA